MSNARINRAPSAIPAEGATAHNRQTANNPLIWTPRCPPIEQSLIDYLRGQFPLRLTREQELRDVDALRGQHDLIAHLERVMRDQETETTNVHL